MKIAAVICEFNPFHNGHAYLLKQARLLTACDAVLCVMSGNFVQRARPAVADMRLRAKTALLCGADAVVELPVLYATACGERFSQGAVNIINSIPSVSHLVFGSESGDLNYLEAAASIQAEESERFKNNLKLFLDTGVPYAAAYAKATAEETGEAAPRLANDILAIEYLKQLIRTNSRIQPHTVTRIGSGYHDIDFQGTFSSATAIRAMIEKGEIEAAKTAIPEAAHLLLQNSVSAAAYERFGLLVTSSLRTRDFSACPDAGEGLDVKLKKSAQRFADLDTIISSAKSKRYTESRIRRLCLQVLLNITHYPLLGDVMIPAKLIGVKEELKSDFLKILPKNVIVKNKDFEKYLYTLPPQTHQHAIYIRRLNKTAADIYSLITARDGDCYDNEPLLVV